MLYAVLLSAALSCSPATGNIVAHDTLVLDPSSLCFTGAASRQTVGVTTTFTGIGVDVTEDWCGATLSGDNTRLTISVEAFDGLSRTATVTLRAPKGKTAAVAVIQSTEGSGIAAFSFGLIADIQYADTGTANNRYYRKSLQKLEECVEDLNSRQVAFTVNLGDLVDRDTPENLGAVLARLNGLDSVLHNTTGNHDYGNVSDNAALYARLGMPAAYYSFTLPGWRFIMLDTNEISEYANPTAAGLAELERLRQAMKAAGRRYAPYNGGISAGQMEWLERELQKSAGESVNTVVFSHHPLYGPDGLTALNGPEIADLLSEYAATVRCAFAGHHHPGAYGVWGGIPYITIEGMVETEENAYATVTVYPDKIEIRGKGRARSHTVPLK